MTPQVTIQQAFAEREKLREAIQSALSDFNRATWLVCTDIRVEVINVGKVGGGTGLIQGAVSVEVRLP